MKRGQVTLFVILGIVLIFVLIGAYYVSTSFKKTIAEKNVVQEADLSADEVNVKNEIEDCIYSLAEDSILYTAARGGYYRPPSKIEFMNNVEIPYYFYKSEENVPTLDTLQEQIAMYIDANAEKCVPDNANLLEEPSSTAVLTDTQLKIETDMPVSIGDSSERRLNFYTAEIDTKYKHILDDALDVYSKLSIIDNFLFVDLSELALNKEFEMRNSINGEKIITLLLYKNYKVKETPLRFNFAIMHDAEKRAEVDDIYSQNTLEAIVMGLKQAFSAKEITSDEDYEAEEQKYEGAIIQAAGAIQ